MLLNDLLVGKGIDPTQVLVLRHRPNEPELRKVLPWLAAEQGNAGAQYALGVMYERGQGVPQDYVQAHMWSNLAASRSGAKERRDIAVKNRDVLASRMTPAQLAEAQKLAREWKPK